MQEQNISSAGTTRARPFFAFPTLLFGVFIGLLFATLFRRPFVEPVHAATNAPGVKLGHSSQVVLQQDGAPSRILYGPDLQIWYYPDEKGNLQPRYELNQGCVVTLRGEVNR